MKAKFNETVDEYLAEIVNVSFGFEFISKCLRIKYKQQNHIFSASRFITLRRISVKSEDKFRTELSKRN